MSEKNQNGSFVLRTEKFSYLVDSNFDLKAIEIVEPKNISDWE